MSTTSTTMETDTQNEKRSRSASDKTLQDDSEYAIIDFAFFFYRFFSLAILRVDGIWIDPPHVEEWCYRLQFQKRTATISARLHLKSIVAMAFVAWNLYRNDKRYLEIEYMGYKTDLASYQLVKLKRYLNELPELFGDFVSLTKADTFLHCTKNGHEFLCQPSGILSFKRGRHPAMMICDDILRDPEVKLDLTQVEKITRIFVEEIEPMPTGALHVVGTPQDEQDLFSVLDRTEKYDVRRYPAEDPETGAVLWEGRYPKKELESIRKTVGDKAYKKEYLCQPVRGLESFIDQAKARRIIKPRLRNKSVNTETKLHEYAYAGFDIGKKTHPSHLVVLGVDRKGRAVQLHSKWMDGWDYVDQIEYCQRAIDAFNIDVMYYDNTRAEFEGFREQGELPDGMFGVVFTSKNKFKMATELDKLVTTERLWLLNEKRQTSQLLSVDNDLKAPETAEGHGDSFFSLCLAVTAFLKGQGEIVWQL